jgi:ribonuclease G
VIVRTVGEELTEDHFKRELDSLLKLWKKIKKKSTFVRAPAVVQRETSLTRGIIRDLFSAKVDHLAVDSKELHHEIIAYLDQVGPELKERVELYAGDPPLFDKYEIEAEIRNLFNRRVDLPTGGYVVIEQTEALVSIDVNTGRFTGKKNQEETIFRTNMEAAKEVPRQLRLRDIGGIIVVDFIDMDIEANKRAVLDELRTELRKDRARTKAFAVSELGLIEMTRQRERSSLLHYYTEDCPHCAGLGKVPSLETMLVKLERAMRRVVAMGGDRRITVKVAPEVALYFVEQEARRFAELEKRFKLQVDLKDDPQLKRGEMRVFSVARKAELTKQVVGAVPGT